jgi:hypothetical protein
MLTVHNGIDALYLTIPPEAEIDDSYAAALP